MILRDTKLRQIAAKPGDIQMKGGDGSDSFERLLLELISDVNGFWKDGYTVCQYVNPGKQS